MGKKLDQQRTRVRPDVVCGAAQFRAAGRRELALSPLRVRSADAEDEARCAPRPAGVVRDAFAGGGGGPCRHGSPGGGRAASREARAARLPGRRAADRLRPSLRLARRGEARGGARRVRHRPPWPALPGRRRLDRRVHGLPAPARRRARRGLRRCIRPAELAHPERRSRDGARAL